MTTRVGVLALQGGFAAHTAALARLGVEADEVRTVAQLDCVDALVMPGGESTTMSMLLDSSGIFEPLQRRLWDGMAVLGTCAGLILLACEVLDGRPDQHLFRVIDLTARRNAYGRQIDSFETELDIVGFDGGFLGVFIRAPVVERVGADVEILAEVNDFPVLCRQGMVTVASFHPELANDGRLHAWWLSGCGIGPAI